ncbi:MAG: hypothetical protein KZQ94_20865, partial [Candidatus Thiodiazotropha sp. (ex Troendleina suluensis)]|nr:hypothetical protein [Candidatus Thiodiazotropha sp. (ex Troendleina suluensis)]
HKCFISWRGEVLTLPAGLSSTNCTYYPKPPHIALGLTMHNEGPGIASDLFSVVRTGSIPGGNSRIIYTINHGDTWTGYIENEIQLSLITRPDIRLPPGANLQPTVIHIYLQPPFEKKLHIIGSVGARESVIHSFIIENDIDILNEQFQRYMNSVITSGFNDGEEIDIVEKILNL